VNDRHAVASTSHHGVSHRVLPVLGARHAADHVGAGVEQLTPLDESWMKAGAVCPLEQLDGVLHALVEGVDRLRVDRRVVEELAQDLVAELSVEGGVEHAGVEHLVDRNLEHGVDRARRDERNETEPLSEGGDLVARVLLGEAHVRGHGADDGSEVDRFHRLPHLRR
jgi:hypothetical protein